MTVSTEYPDHNPKTRQGAKKLDLSLVPMSIIIGLARAMADGAKKYGPFNWRLKKISSMVYIGACLRHIARWIDGEDYAPDSKVHHLDHALACLGLLRDAESIGMLNDNRPPSGASPYLLDAYEGVDEPEDGEEYCEVCSIPVKLLLNPTDCGVCTPECPYFGVGNNSDSS